MIGGMFSQVIGYICTVTGRPGTELTVVHDSVCIQADIYRRVGVDAL